MKKRLLTISMVVIGLLFFAVSSRDVCAASPAPITWKAIGPFQIDYPEIKLWVLPFIKKVNERAKGRFSIEYVRRPVSEIEK